LVVADGPAGDVGEPAWVEEHADAVGPWLAGDGWVVEGELDWRRGDGAAGDDLVDVDGGFAVSGEAEREVSGSDGDGVDGGGGFAERAALEVDVCAFGGAFEEDGTGDWRERGIEVVEAAWGPWEIALVTPDEEGEGGDGAVDGECGGAAEPCEAVVADLAGGAEGVGHGASAGEAFFGIGGAGFADDVVEGAPHGAVYGVAEVVWEFWELESVVAGGHFVEDHAETVEVCGGGAWAFWGDEAFCADVGVLAFCGDEADVGEFGLTVDEDDVGRLDVAVGESVFVEVDEGVGEGDAVVDAFLDGETAVGGAVGAHGAGLVLSGVDAAPAVAVVAEFHDVVVEAFVVVSADVEDVDEALVVAGDGFEFADAVEFAFEGTVEFEVFAADDFDGAEGSGDAFGEPDLAIAAPADAAQDLVVGDARGIGTDGDELR